MAESHHARSRDLVTHLVGYLAIGAVAALLTLGLLPRSTHGLGPGVVSTGAHLGEGTTTLEIPPLGTISARTHEGPLELTVALDKLDPTALTNAVVSATSQQVLVENLAGDLRNAVRSAALWLLLGAAVLGGLAGALLPHRRTASVVGSAAGGVLAVALSLVATAMTFDVDAFEEPRFTGALRRAPAVIDAVNRRIGSLAELRSRYDAAAERLTSLLALVAGPQQGPRVGSTAILHISDIHSNPLGVELASQLAQNFDVDAVLDTGDLTSFGAPVESRIGALIEDIPVPYLLVPGNHDSDLNRRALARRDNVVLLDGDSEEIGGVEILGFADPTFTASNEITTEQGNRSRFEESERVALAVDLVDPDVLAVHDARLSSEAIGGVPVVVAGHTHERSIREEEGTVILTVGSTGATGLGSFIVEAELDYEAEVLYFRAGRLIAIDYVSLDALGADFEVERTTFDVL